jgi:hypothetical protein
VNPAGELDNSSSARYLLACLNPSRRNLFLSYRRDDSSGHAGRLFDKLTGYYGRGSVFRDVHAIYPADRFRAAIATALSECNVVLVIISKQWGAIVDAAGVRRIAAPDDVVRWEIETALDLSAQGVTVIPILVSGASMPRAESLPPTIQALSAINPHEISELRWDYDFERLIDFINRIAPVATPAAYMNPFSTRGAIRNDELFFDRDPERRIIRDYLNARQNCQIVGARRIGKSSLLLFVERHCREWCPQARVAYIDLQDPRCYTLAGWLKEVAHGFGLGAVPLTLSELMEAVEDLLANGVHPVLCLDEFGEMARRPQQFSREVFLTLRACGQRGMSILTAAPKRLSELTDPQDDTSPFFNTFSVLTLRVFGAPEAQRYLDIARPGVPAFTDREKDRILEFAHGHPLALQSAAFHVLAARDLDGDLPAALTRAKQDCGKTEF